jgi:hypothetical protein
MESFQRLAEAHLLLLRRPLRELRRPRQRLVQGLPADVCGQPGVLPYQRHQSLVVVGPGVIVTRPLPGVDVQFLHHGLRYRPDPYGAIPPYHEARAIVTCSLPGVDVQFLHHGAGHWPYFVGPGVIVTRSLPGVDVQFLHHGAKVRCCDAAGALSVFGRLN